MTTYRSKRTLAHRTTALALGLAALGALMSSSGKAAAADLLVCTGTELDLRAELAQVLVDTTPNGLTPYPIAAANPNTDAGRLDDGSVELTNGIVSQIFPLGIPFIDANPITPGLQRWTQIFANVNGNITFRNPLASFTPQAIPGLTQPTIAAYFGDVDLRAAGSQFSLCIEPANQRLFVTWRTVGYYNANSDLQNSFQIVLTNNDDQVCLANGNFEVEFRYQEDLEWTTGDADGLADNGLGDPEATAGIDAGDTINAIALPGSGTAAVLDLDTETNANEGGVHRFLVAEGTLPRCGNSIVNLCEQCDDGDDDNNDACTNLCLNAACGDGFVQAGEACDTVEFPAGTQCPAGYSGAPLCNNDPANLAGNNTCTLDVVPEGCTDLNECVLGTDNCSANGTCSNTPGSFTCDCNDGFEGNGVTCDDIDECATNTDDCDTDATCTNTPPGSFTCDCNDGFEGNGVTCDDIDECATNTDNCNDDATCTNAVPGFDCDCNDGFSGNGIICTPDGAGGGGGQGGAGGSGNGGGGQGGSGNGGSGNGGAGGAGNGGAGNGGSGNGGSGNGGSGNGGSGSGANGPTSSTGSGANGSGSTGSGSTGTDGATQSNGSGNEGGGSSDGLDGAVASGGVTCAVTTPGSDGSREGLAFLALAGAVVVSRRRRS